MRAATQLSGLKQSATNFWSERNRRERNLLTAAAAVIVLGLIYLLLIDPAVSGRAMLQKQLPVLRQQSAEVQALAKDAKNAAGAGNTSAPPRMTRENIESSLARKGLKAQNLVVAGEQTKVQLSSVSFASTIDWLTEVQKTARMSVVEAVVDAQAQPDTVNANFTLRQQGQTQ